MGDILHTLPALTDAADAIPDIQFDWLIEPDFEEIPHWHKNVARVIALPLRQLRKSRFRGVSRQQALAAIKSIREKPYDLIIDAQGLFKSAVFAKLAKGPVHGLSWRSARESIASLFYKKTAYVSWDQHAIDRIRSLFATLLGYPKPVGHPKYGIDWDKFPKVTFDKPYIMFSHGTTWETKHWPLHYWVRLAQIAESEGFDIKLTGVTPAQQQRAQHIATEVSSVKVLPPLSLEEAAVTIGHASANIGVDTGFCHLSAALGVPTVSVYGPTDPVKTGALGEKQRYIQSTKSCAPCFSKTCTYPKNEHAIYPPCFIEITPEKVWEKLQTILN